MCIPSRGSWVVSSKLPSPPLPGLGPDVPVGFFINHGAVAALQVSRWFLSNFVFCFPFPPRVIRGELNAGGGTCRLGSQLAKPDPRLPDAQAGSGAWACPGRAASHLPAPALVWGRAAQVRLWLYCWSPVSQDHRSLSFHIRGGGPVLRASVYCRPVAGVETDVCVLPVVPHV